MRRPIITILAFMAAFICCKDGTDSDILHFPNCELYPLYDLLPQGMEGVMDYGAQRLGWPIWSPDGNEIVFIQQGVLWSIPSSGGQATQLTSLEGLNRYPNWSPVVESNEVVFVNTLPSGTNTIYRFQPGYRKPDPVISIESGIEHTSFSHNGGTIVFLQPGKDGIYTVPADSGRVKQVPNSKGWADNRIITAQASPAENRIYYIEETTEETERGTAYIYSLRSIGIEGGEPVTVIEVITKKGSADYRTIAMSISYDGTMAVWTEFRNIRFRNNNVRYSPKYPSWFFDGSKLSLFLNDSQVGDFKLYIAELKI
jgi:Tol biopolymer transport system component